MSCDDAEGKTEQKKGQFSWPALFWRDWKKVEKWLKQMGNAEGGRVRKESRCWEGKGGDLPHAVCVQKWRVDEAQAVVCYHSNIGKQGRRNKKPHRFHGKIIIQSACFSIVIAVDYLCARTVPKINRAEVNIWNPESRTTLKLIQTQFLWLSDFQRRTGLLRVKLSFFPEFITVSFWTVSLSRLSHNIINTS